MKRLIIATMCFIFLRCSFASDTISVVYKIDIKKEIGSNTWLYLKNGLASATEQNAKIVVLHLNTYGGFVSFADSMRTAILNYDKPVYVFIDNNAASAGALISIACDSIYMRPGANIGAATVVGQSGEVMPDKYQSYMRATIRSTAEAQGKDTIIIKNDTIYKWRRDPHIAEAMVDASIKIAGITDSGKVLTFTALEAIKHGYCEGLANNVAEVVAKSGIEDYVIKSYKPTFFDEYKGFFMNPVLQGVLIMLIVGGIYFELQSPGIGFPLIAAIIAGLLYLTPLYIDGIAQYWEIILIFIGLALLVLEIFVIPGFGIAGVGGIFFVITGLVLAMIENNFFDIPKGSSGTVLQAVAVVLVGLTGGVALSIFLTRKAMDYGPFKNVALAAKQEISEGFIGVPMQNAMMIGKSGVAHTVLRPSGKVEIDGEFYDAVAESGYIEKGDKVVVLKYETGQIYVLKT